MMYKTFSVAALAVLLGACGGGTYNGPPLDSNGEQSSSESSSLSSVSSSSESSSASSEPEVEADGVWNVYDASYSPFTMGSVLLASGGWSEFRLAGNDLGRDIVAFELLGNGTVGFDTTADPAYHHYAVIDNIVPNDGVYPKTLTVIAGVTGPDDSNRVLDLEFALADADSDGTRIKAIIRADGNNTGVQLERVIPATNTPADSRQYYGLDMRGVFRVYHFAIELTEPTRGSVRVYLDGSSEPLAHEDPSQSLLIDDQPLRRTASPGENFLRFGDTGGNAYKGVIDWVIWTDQGAFSPSDLAGDLPAHMGCVIGYGASENIDSCEREVEEPGERDYTFDLSYWKITLPDGSERNVQWLLDGATSANEFFYNADGSMVFRSPNIAGTTTNTSYSRTELREMLRGTNNSIPTRGFSLNNWALSSASEDIKAQVGGIDGRMRATLAVDHVSTTGNSNRVGRVIIGQIHGSEDEPVRLYYRKLPGNSKGSVYFAHEQFGGSDTWYELIGSRSDNAPDPADGIALGERFSYEIDVQGLTLTVTIRREGKPDVSRTITMDSAYSDDWMYFKAGVYNQNNTGSEDDYVQATFFELDVTHDEP